MIVSREHIKVMLLQQYRLNKHIHYKWWIQGFKWHTAIIAELSECLEHINWEWWVKRETNEEMARLELVDVAHFGFSLMLQKELRDGVCVYTAADNVADKVYESLQEGSSVEGIVEVLEGMQRDALMESDFDLNKFAKASHLLGMEFVDLYALFVQKNCLNMFRVDKGYGIGCYDKVWSINGVSKPDNEWLLGLASSEDVLDLEFFDHLYTGLRTLYRERG